MATTQLQYSSRQSINRPINAQGFDVRILVKKDFEAVLNESEGIDV